MLTAIKFPCTWRDGTGREHFAVHEFTLGFGPCGKNVVELAMAVNEMGTVLGIVQLCSDGSKKSFTYPLSTVLGRIEETREILQ